MLNANNLRGSLGGGRYRVSVTVFGLHLMDTVK
jgi:hypothetical protein